MKSPLQIIRLHCLDCANGSSLEVEKCPCEACKLWPYRFGRNPYRAKRVLSEEQREKLRIRLARNSSPQAVGSESQGTKISGIAEQEFEDWIRK